MGDLREYPFEPVLADLFRLDPRFIGRVEAPDGEGGCWIWTGGYGKGGAKNTKKYGRIRVPRMGKKEYVHRRVFKLFWGAITPGWEVHHDCDGSGRGDGLCIQPRHLEEAEPTEHRARHAYTLHRGRRG